MNLLKHDLDIKIIWYDINFYTYISIYFYVYIYL